MKNFTSNLKFTFYSRWWVDHMLGKLATGGMDVLGTKEFVNVGISVPGLPKDATSVWNSFKASTSQVENLLVAVYRGDNSYVSDIYDSSYYTFLLEAISKAREVYKNDNLLSRRLVVSFPSTHCFESIQVILRDGTANIIVNMRSCNAVKNLMSDLYLGYRLGHIMLAESGVDFDNVNIYANIGSLHIFEEDLKDVLRNA